jgi:hypothetical protein
VALHLHFDARSARDERKNQLNKATEIETAAWPVLRAVSIAISGGVSIGGGVRVPTTSRRD